jgi:hypothetical protein
MEIYAMPLDFNTTIFLCAFFGITKTMQLQLSDARKRAA